MYVFSVNGFPYGDFGIGIVKTNVYEPGWDDERRLTYTCKLAELLAQLPGPDRRTISTVALGYRPNFSEPNQVKKAVYLLRRACETLKSIHAKTGVLIELCLEPEPATYLETTEDVLAFFLSYGLVQDSTFNPYLSIATTRAIRLMFESPKASIEALHEAGIRIGKCKFQTPFCNNTE